MDADDLIVDKDDKLLVTGANGFIGKRVAEALLESGFRNLTCFVRPSGNPFGSTVKDRPGEIKVIEGNLLSREDCKQATKDVSVIFHLAAGIGKSYPTCFLNSVVTTRNLLDAALAEKAFKRFLNVSSFAVYSAWRLKRGQILDETCQIETQPEKRGEAYCYGKAKQDELLMEYNREFSLPYAIIRPGAVYGPGKNTITGRIGIDTFGVYLHMGGSNQIPFTYVDNCADAIVLAGTKKRADGEVFNVVDDDLPTSREFLKMYKKRVKNFHSISINRNLSYLLCFLWERYSKWSGGQLPPAFNRSRWTAEWKGQRYSNQKIKRLLGWKQKIPTAEALDRYFDYSRKAGRK